MLVSACMGCMISFHYRHGTQCGAGSCGGWVLVLDIDCMQYSLPLTEGDTSPLIGGSYHTAVFSIRTVVCGTTIQSRGQKKHLW